MTEAQSKETKVEVATKGRLQLILDNMESNSTNLIEVVNRLQQTCQRIGLDVTYTREAQEYTEIIDTLNSLDQENNLHSLLVDYLFNLTTLLEGL